MRSAPAIAAEQDLDAERLGATLQDVEEDLARQAGETVTARGHDLAAIMDIDGVPVGEAPRDLAVCLGIGRGDVAERLIGEHDAPAERVLRAVALDDDDPMRRIEALHQDGEEQPGRAAADAYDMHADRFALRQSRDRRNLF
jgi:hypothetical protein